MPLNDEGMLYCKKNEIGKIECHLGMEKEVSFIADMVEVPEKKSIATRMDKGGVTFFASRGKDLDIKDISKGEYQKIIELHTKNQKNAGD